MDESGTLLHSLEGYNYDSCLGFMTMYVHKPRPWAIALGLGWFTAINCTINVDSYSSITILLHVQCRAGVGACPDTLDSSETCTNDIMDVSGSVTNGQQCVSFTRPFSTSKSFIVVYVATISVKATDFNNTDCMCIN